MKRDWDCIAGVLSAIEALPEPFDAPGLGKLPAGKAVASAHLELLIEAGLVVRVQRPECARADGLRLTWAGHELLDHLRSRRLYARVRAAAAAEYLSLSHEVFTALATASLRRWQEGTP